MFSSLATCGDGEAHAISVRFQSRQANWTKKSPTPGRCADVFFAAAKHRAFQMRFHLLLVFFLANAASAADGPTTTTTTLYKSTGPDGKTIYSDLPQPQARDSRTLTFRNLPASPLSAETLAYIEQLRKSADIRGSATPPRDTVLFSAKWCSYCRQAKAYLAAKSIGYREVDIDTAEGKMAYARLGGNNGVPQLFVNGQGVTGFSTPAYDSLFQTRR